ncbi:LysR substrate-binding domain-containing protein [Streptomyces rubiginosohelvolus]|uniref:LysR substrate-binding domain-containing protein n=1 Tax=Streptomyces rubiginosohelvolus TaxID=67362 RepID=UPI00367AE940
MSNPVTFVQFPSTGDAMNAVADRSVDAGCMVDLDGFGVPLPEGVVVDVIGLEPVVVILPAGHPRAGQDRVGLADLADETWLLPPYDAGCDDYGALADACAPAGFAPPRVSPQRIGDLGVLCMRRFTGDPLLERHLLAAHRDSPLFGARPLLLDLVRAAFEARCFTPG